MKEMREAGSETRQHCLFRGSRIANAAAAQRRRLRTLAGPSNLRSPEADGYSRMAVA